VSKLAVHDESVETRSAAQLHMRADVVVCGAGPAGLAVAERAALAGASVIVVDAKRSPGRKFLLAGRSGLNLTHSETLVSLLDRFDGSAAPFVRDAIRSYPPTLLRDWSARLGEETFEGSSGRVFPQSMRATPLLRAWLTRLESLGVTLQTEWRWVGPGELQGVGQRDGQMCTYDAAATVLAFGGASWPRTGSDGGWISAMRSARVGVADLLPSNVGVLVDWSPVLLAKSEGEPIKNVVVTCGDRTARGDVVITKTGLEGGPIYSVSGNVHHSFPLVINVRPNVSSEQVAASLDAIRPADSLSNRLRKVGLSKSAVGLMLECGARSLATTDELARMVHQVVVPTIGVASIDRAISSSGGVLGTMIDDTGMLKGIPGTFVAGEMLDWDAPTGGYLLQGCWSTGCRVGDAVARYVGR
jgi:uncharacterized flavoprotein (TIGR03862 family)